MQIIPASIGDLEDIVQLNNLFHLEIHNFRWDTPKWIFEEITKGNYFIGIENGEVIAATCLLDSEEFISIETIAVNSSRQKEGIGRAIIRFAEIYAADRGKKEIRVDSFQEYNLQKFYEASGFKLGSTNEYEGHKYDCFSIKI